MDSEIKNAISEKTAKTFDAIVICDISPSEETAELIEENPYNQKIILIDHHASAMWLNKYNWAVVTDKIPSDSDRNSFYIDDNAVKNAHTSATGLLYDYLDITGHTVKFKNKALALCMTHTISAYDCWDWVNIFNSAKSYKSFNNLFYIYGNEIFEKKMIKKLKSENTELLDETDKMFLQIDEKKRNASLELIKPSIKKGKITIDDKTYSITITANASNCIPDTFAYMREQYPDADIHFIITTYSIAMRTNKPDIDLSVIAKRFGGGGHPGAAGIPIELTKQLDIVSNIMSANINID